VHSSQIRDPGVVRRAIYCDESGIGGAQKHYGFGALFMAYQRRGDFAADLAAMQKEHRWPGDEIKWNKCSSSNLSFYKELVDYFFSQSFLFFHCIIVERAWVKIRQYHDGSFDLARRKHFTQFLSNKLARIARVHPKREIWTRVYVDRIPSAYTKAGEAMHVIGNRSARKLAPLSHLAAEAGPIDGIFECDSKDQLGIQLCDLLLGAVVDTWNQGSTSAHKSALRRHIATYLGWDDLRSDTVPAERKFNIWWLTDQVKAGQSRPVVTRRVELKHPLPALKTRR
jgi:hypothetical protein